MIDNKRKEFLNKMFGLIIDDAGNINWNMKETNYFIYKNNGDYGIKFNLIETKYGDKWLFEIKDKKYWLPTWALTKLYKDGEYWGVCITLKDKDDYLKMHSSSWNGLSIK